MIIADLNRDQPEKIGFSLKNVSATTITTCMAVAYVITGNSADGVSAVPPVSTTANTLPGFAGIAQQDIPVNGYGLVNAYGYAVSIMLSNAATSITINAGDPLIPSSLSGALYSGAPTYANSGGQVVIAMQTVGLSAAAPLYVPGLLQGL